MKKKTVLMLTAAMLLVSITSCTQNPAAKNSTADSQASSQALGGSTQIPGAKSDTLKTQYPVTISSKTPTGVEINQTIEAAPQHVVTGNPSTTELLFELGLGDRIVGTMAWDNTPPQKWAANYKALNILGDKMTMSREIIVGAEPDLVLGRSLTFSESAFGTIESFNSMGIPVYTQLASYMDIDQSLENVIQDVRNIGIIFDVQEKAEEYAVQLEARLAKVKETIVPAQDEKGKTAVIMTAYKERSFAVFGANAMLQSSILETMNITNAMPSGQNDLTLENLVVANPDLIIYVTSDRNAQTDAVAVETLLAEETLKSIPAVKNKMIIEIQYDDLMDYGIRTFDALETISAFLYQ